MTKKQKEFINKASKERKHELYRDLYIADKGTLYDGGFGKNGYNNMVIIGETEDGCLEFITDKSDVFSCFEGKGLNIDIESENGFIRIWLDKHLFKIPMDVYSSCLASVEIKEVKNE